MSEEKKGILLETGTNELEIVTFTVGTNIFSINVMKVREIIHPVPITEVPESHPVIEGVVQVRGEIIPVINLAKMLHLGSRVALEKTKFIIAELNQMKVVFRVDEVHRIQRISWNQIEEPTSLAMGLEETTSGIVKLEDKVILMLDYEKLIHTISPSSGFSPRDVKSMPVSNERGEKNILVAEDSAMLRQLIEETLRESGYTKIILFKNGQEALDYCTTLVNTKKQNLNDFVDLIITDIEMPKLDGHTLTKTLKENPLTQHVPIVIFSSLIAPELEHKGESVGANSQVSKPDIVKLINIMDKLIFD